MKSQVRNAFHDHPLDYPADSPPSPCPIFPHALKLPSRGVGSGCELAASVECQFALCVSAVSVPCTLLVPAAGATLQRLLQFLTSP